MAKTPATKSAVKAPSDDGAWRAQTLERARAAIKSADPGIVEVVKWRKAPNNMQGVPVWELGGIICTGETYKDYVKLTFAHGAKLEDPAGLFNAGFGGDTRRAIDFRKDDKVSEKALKALVKSAVAFNAGNTPAKAKKAAKPTTK